MDLFKKIISKIISGVFYGCINSLLVSFITPKIKMLWKEIKSKLIKKNLQQTKYKRYYQYIKPMDVSNWLWYKVYKENLQY